VAVAESPADQVRRVAVDAPDGIPPLQALDKVIGDARVVLIGESSHGTHDFYQARAEITKWLIDSKGFAGVAAEADWPDAYRVNRFVRGIGEDETAEEALRGFERFPTWMWRNTVLRDFADWLRERNERVEPRRQAGFYGLDLYSLHRSMHEVITYLETVDHEAAARARHRYSCFDHASARRRRAGIRIRGGVRCRPILRAAGGGPIGRNSAQRAALRAPRRTSRRR